MQKHARLLQRNVVGSRMHTNAGAVRLASSSQEVCTHVYGSEDHGLPRSTVATYGMNDNARPSNRLRKLTNHAVFTGNKQESRRHSVRRKSKPCHPYVCLEAWGLLREVAESSGCNCPPRPAEAHDPLAAIMLNSQCILTCKVFVLNL